MDVRLAKIGRSRRVALRVPHFLSAPLLLAQTDSALTAPRRLLAAFAKMTDLRLHPPPLELPTFQLSLLWRPRMQADPGCQWLRGAFADSIA